MGAYQYVAVDAGGKEHRGVLEGDTPRHVRQLLRERQLLPVDFFEPHCLGQPRSKLSPQRFVIRQVLGFRPWHLQHQQLHGSRPVGKEAF